MYEVEIVGTSLPQKIASTNALIDEYRNKVLDQIGNLVRKKIQDKINSFNFKHGSPETLMRAVKIKVDKRNLEVIIYNDNRIAPHAIYQEKGVFAHKMDYLKGKVIPFVSINNHFVFAGRGSPYYNAKDKKFVKVTEKSLAIPGKWFNPGYAGRYFYRDGLKEAVQEIAQHLKHFTFRVSSGEIFR